MRVHACACVLVLCVCAYVCCAYVRMRMRVCVLRVCAYVFMRACVCAYECVHVWPLQTGEGGARMSACTHV